MRDDLPGVRKRRILSPQLRVKLPFTLIALSLLCGCATQPTPKPDIVPAPEVTVEPSVQGPRTLDEVVATLERFDVSGTVVSKDDKPVRGAEVFLYYARGRDGLRDRLAGRAKTDRRGRFKFEKAVVWEPVTETKSYQPPRYAIIARHPRHGIDFAILLQEDKRDDIKIALGVPKFTEVTVKDLDGNPIEGARLFLFGGENRKADRNHRYLRLYQDIGVSSGVTDEAGTVKLMRPPGPYFYAEKAGFVRGTVRGRLATLFPSAQVSGKATFEDGAPAAGAAVWFSYTGNRLGWSDATLTDDEGNFVFENIPGAGFYYSSMSPEAQEAEKKTVGDADLLVEDLRPDSPFKSQKVSFRIKPGDKLTEDLVLKRGVVFAGKVVDLTTNVPVQNMNMTLLIPTTGRRLDSYDVSTDERGEFRTTVSPGSEVWLNWETHSRTGDYIIDQEWLNQGNYDAFRGVVTKDMADLVFKVKVWPVNRLTGRVVDEEGEGVEGTSVYIHSNVPGVKTDDTGTFTLKVAPKDRDFELFAVTDDKTKAGLAELKAGSTEATISLEPTLDYGGQVTNTEGLPAGDLTFYLDLRLNESTLYRVRLEPRTNADGEFSAERLFPKGTYYAWWSSDNVDNRDYSYGNATIDLAKLKPGEPIRFEAKQYLNALMGRVLNEEGKPVEGARVQVTSWDMVPQDVRFQREPIKSDKNGEFVAERLAPGEVTLRISAEGYKARSATAPSDSIDFETVLRPISEGSVYEIAVVDGDDQPVPNAALVLSLTLRQEGEESAHSETTHTDSDGKASFSFKPAGDKVYGRGIVGCDPEGYTVAYRGVQINEDVECHLVVRKSDDLWTGRVVDLEEEPIDAAEVRVVGMRQGKDYLAHASFEGLLDSEYTDDSVRDLLDFRYTTDEDGRFELTRFDRKDAVSLEISAPGYAVEQAWLGPEWQARTIFSLSPGAIVKGTVIVKETGEPEPTNEAAIILCGSRVANRRLKRGDKGTFSLADVKPGQYDLWYLPTTPEGRKYVCASPPSFTAAPGETVEVTLEIEEGILVKGKFIDANTGKAPEGWKNIHAFRSSNRYDPVINDDGTWEIYLPEGETDLQYMVEGMRGYETFKTLELEKGEVYEGLVIEVNKDAE